jgi:hypothetical protein
MNYWGKTQSNVIYEGENVYGLFDHTVNI